MPPLPGETGSTPLAAQRSVADAGDPVTAAPTLGATPLQRTLADPPAPVGPAGQALPQLPVVPEQVVARSFVMAPPPPTARPALPVVAGSSAGEYLQRSAATSPGAPATSASASATPTTAALDAGRTAPGLVGGAPDAAGPSPVAGAASARPDAGASGLMSTAAAPPNPPGRAPLLADVPPAPQLTSGASTEPIDGPSTPTVSRLAAGPTPAPRRLGLGAPLTRPPHRPSGSPGETGPVVQMLPTGPAGPVDVSGPVGAAPSPSVEPTGSDIPTAADVPGSSAEYGAVAHVERLHLGLPAGSTGVGHAGAGHTRAGRARHRARRFLVAGGPGARNPAAGRSSDHDRAAALRHPGRPAVRCGRRRPDPLG